ncbi:hypothetical protein STRAU_5282 [Streptomyces aurantiacus JA 4570]|uniref:Uncharacterized protein n=1 Tax=Streptomyces aurantiacus JA 4570 TaxID=1286094 RepID=S4AJN2_9ACTN|nr:hypothetical protein STRAU_5282 [Streptomyces aurantiacus JA 4570]
MAIPPPIPYASHVPDALQSAHGGPLSPHRLVAQDAALSRR